MSILNLQKTNIEYKILISNIRSEIWSDHKAALYDTSKIFETLVKHLYNIYYHTEDFEVLKKVNNPAIDIVSISKKIVVSVKSSPKNQTKKQIDKSYSLFLKEFPQFIGFEFFLQELCDDPKNKIISSNSELRYFSFMENMFNDDFNKLKMAMQLSSFQTSSIKTKSILNYFYYFYLVDIGMRISEIYGLTGLQKNIIVENYRFENLNIDRAKSVRNGIEPKCISMWNEINKKQYLYSEFENVVISIFDKLWWAGYTNNSFDFKHVYDTVLTYDNNKVKSLNESVEETKKLHPLYFFHRQLIEILECIKQIKDILNS